MSLYGALFGGVSGLRAQSSKIGTISDNIANVNTVGYKQADIAFQTLVVNANSTVSYQTGGVRGTTVLDVTKQGLLQATESATDLAISGGGFFVVRAVADPTTAGANATPLYTRAGSFTQDSLGNFVNAQGYYLQGWPLDRDGRLPGEPGNLNTIASSNFDSLQTVNVQSASGVASGTTSISFGANLRQSEVIFPGEEQLLVTDNSNSANRNLAADAVLVGSEYGLATQNSIRRGDQFQITTGGGLQYGYEYGGYVIGRDATTVQGTVNFGDGAFNNTASVPLTTASDVTFLGGSTFQVTIPNHGIISGDTVTLSGFAAVGATSAAEINAPQIITRTGLNTFTFTVTTPPGVAVGTNIGGAGRAANTRQFAGNIMDASSATQTFLGQLGVSGFSAAALSFTISSASAGVRTFTYATSSPNTQTGQFNNLNTLATAINQVNGLSARVTGGRLVIAADDASEAITFANGDATGTSTLRGINWLQELDLTNLAAGNRRFNSLQGLSNIVNGDLGVSARVNNPLSNSTLTINVDDPLDTIQFQDSTTPPFTIPNVGTPIAVPAGTFGAGSNIAIVITDATPAPVSVGQSIYLSGLTNGIGGLPGSLPNGGPWQVTNVSGTTYTVQLVTPTDVTTAGGNFASTLNSKVSIAGTSNQGSLLAELGVVTSLSGGTYVPQNSGVLGPRYDPAGAIGQNMASGDITAQFSRNVRVFDSFGSGHDIRFSYIKISLNRWAVEVHVIPASDINSTLPDGQIATGIVEFNGDGTLRSLDGSINGPIPVTWNNGSITSIITLDLGTAGEPFGTPGATSIGLTDGLSQFDSAYNVNFVNQNGAPVGQLTSVAIDSDGIVTASYTNGETQALFRLPLAAFANPNGLSAVTGNVYSQTRGSGEVNLREAGTNGTGDVVAAALEQSNVDLAEQLTDMIVAQRSYQANTKVIKTADELLSQLNQI